MFIEQPLTLLVLLITRLLNIKFCFTTPAILAGARCASSTWYGVGAGDLGAGADIINVICCT